MADDKKETTPTKPKAASASKPAEKKAAPKAPSKAAGYIVAEGKSIAASRRIFQPGEPITAADVADLEALLKGGFVVKA